MSESTNGIFGGWDVEMPVLPTSPTTIVGEPQSWDELFQQVTYKKYWKFSCGLPSYTGPSVLIFVDIFNVEDTYHPGRMIRVRHIRPAPEFDQLGLKRALDHLRNVISYVEQHESDEWLRYKGEMIYNPHA
jgi:hypothetical protein